MNKNKLKENLNKLYVNSKIDENTKVLSFEYFENNAIKLLVENEYKNQYEWFFKNHSAFLVNKSLKINYSEFVKKGFNYKIDKNMYQFFYSLHRKGEIFDEVPLEQLFKLIEALEALHSFNFRVVELKKWSKWLKKVFDEDILQEYIKYIKNPITYFLVVIKDNLQPLANNLINPKKFFEIVKNIQEPFQNSILENEKEYKVLFEKIKKKELDKKNIEFTKSETKIVKPLKKFANMFKISLLRVFQFFSFPFYIDELKEMPYQLLLKFSDNLIVYSENHYWGISQSTTEYLFRQINKYKKIYFYTKNFLSSISNFDDSRINQVINLFNFVKSEEGIQLLINIDYEIFKNKISQEDKTQLSYLDAKENNSSLLDKTLNKETIIN